MVYGNSTRCIPEQTPTLQERLVEGFRAAYPAERADGYVQPRFLRDVKAGLIPLAPKLEMAMNTLGLHPRFQPRRLRDVLSAAVAEHVTVRFNIPSPSFAEASFAEQVAQSALDPWQTRDARALSLGDLYTIRDLAARQRTAADDYFAAVCREIRDRTLGVRRLGAASPRWAVTPVGGAA